MRGVNKAIIVGRLGNDPEVRAMPNGDSVATISLATSEKWTDKNTGEQKELTEWHKVVFYGNLADIVAKYLKKGSQAYIEGSIHTRKWQDQSGQDKYSTEIKAKELQMLSSKESGQQQAPPRNESQHNDFPF